MNKKKLYIIGIVVLVVLLIGGIFMCHKEEANTDPVKDNEQMEEDEGLKVEETDDGYGETIDFEDLVSDDDDSDDTNGSGSGSGNNSGSQSGNGSNSGSGNGSGNGSNSDDSDDKEDDQDKEEDDKNSETSESGWSPFF